MVNYHGREWSLWYKAETTEGTAPTATQYLALAQMAEIRINNQTNPNAVALSGSVDFSEYKNIISGGEAIAIVSGITYFGFVFGPPMMGAISDQIGLRWAMMIPAGLAIILALGAQKVLTSSS